MPSIRLRCPDAPCHMRDNVKICPRILDFRLPFSHKAYVLARILIFSSSIDIISLCTFFSSFFVSSIGSNRKVDQVRSGIVSLRVRPSAPTYRTRGWNSGPAVEAASVSASQRMPSAIYGHENTIFEANSPPLAQNPIAKPDMQSSWRSLDSAADAGCT